MKTANYFAMDFGASTGRGITGRFDGKKLELEEVHRFSNYFVDLNGTFYWDILRMFHETKKAVRLAGKTTGNDGISSIGIDTWGTDYAFLDRNGQMLGNARCMRNADGLGVRAVYKAITPWELFQRTGIQTIYGNTIFQLYERLLNRDTALENADKMLMLPDMLAYFFTGNAEEEYTMATTSMMYNPYKKDWDKELMKKLGLPEHILANIINSAQKQVPVLRTVKEELGMPGLQYVPVGTHDTASAVAAIPLRQDEAFCSSGTWSLFGVESKEPVITEESYRLKFSNEGTVDGHVRLLKNIMGMWVIQQCMEQWQEEGRSLTWDAVVGEAKKAVPFRSIVDLDEPMFYNAGKMIPKIADYCRDTEQPVPETVGEIARCVYESVALKYRKTFLELEEITGRKLNALRIVGGGSNNRMLNQMAADAICRPVYAGPAEGACIGNILVQSMAHGELKNLQEIRQVVENSFETRMYEPENPDVWENAYGIYCAILDRRN